MTLWRVYDMGLDSYYADNTDGGYIDTLSSHCLACAKADLMIETGDLVDIRGWHKQGICGGFLKSMRLVIEEELDGNN